MALAALGVVALSALVQFAWFCPAAHRHVSAIDGSQLILAGGFATARPGDAIYACESPHCVGPLCHEDFECDCAPAPLGPERVGSIVGGRCVVDQADPSRDDDTGACRRARCDEHIDR